MVFEKHLFTSDYHCPDHNEKIVDLLLEFTKDFKPDYFHIVGDFVNFSSVSKYDHDPHYEVDLSVEIETARTLLERVVKVVRESNPQCIIEWNEGNHELRLIKYLIRNAPQFALIKSPNSTVDMVSIPFLFDLKKLGVRWIPMTEIHRTCGTIRIEHGELIRKGSGMTAKAMLDMRGEDGMSGHTHRLALHLKTNGDTKYWVELGCLCNLQPTPPYVISPDWSQGFLVGIFNSESKVFYPQVIPILNNSFMYGDKLYAYERTTTC